MRFEDPIFRSMLFIPDFFFFFSLLLKTKKLFCVDELDADDFAVHSACVTPGCGGWDAHLLWVINDESILTQTVWKVKQQKTHSSDFSHFSEVH